MRKPSTESASAGRHAAVRLHARSRPGNAIAQAQRAGNTAKAQRAGDLTTRGKTRLTMYLDMTVVEYFRSRAGGRGHQTLINEALRHAIEQENLEDVLRQVIREEADPVQSGKFKP